MLPDDLLEQVMSLSHHIRYAALCQRGQLTVRSRPSLTNSGESDNYEEIFVNPTLITLLSQRGHLDCGGFGHVLIRYGSFYQFVYPVAGGHLSAAIEADAPVCELVAEMVRFIDATAFAA